MCTLLVITFLSVGALRELAMCTCGIIWCKKLQGLEVCKGPSFAQAKLRCPYSYLRMAGSDDTFL